MQHGGDADLCAEPLGIAAELQQGLRCCSEEHIEEPAPVVQGDSAELGGHGEDDVEVARGQDALHALLDPRSLAQALALGAVAIATGVVRRHDPTLDRRDTRQQA